MRFCGAGRRRSGLAQAASLAPGFLPKGMRRRCKTGVRGRAAALSAGCYFSHNHCSLYRPGNGVERRRP